MRYGFYLPTRGLTANPGDLEALVRRGEALGFASVMIADHIVFPSVVASKYPYTVSGVFPGQGDALEQLALMAFVAGKTERLRLVTSVMILPYRNPWPRRRRSPPSTCSRGDGSRWAWAWDGSARSSRRSAAADFARRGAVSGRVPCASSRRCGRERPPRSRGSLSLPGRALSCPPPCRSRIRRSGSAVTASAALRRSRPGSATAGIPWARIPRWPLHARLTCGRDLDEAVSAHGGGGPRSLRAHDLLQSPAV